MVSFAIIQLEAWISENHVAGVKLHLVINMVELV